MNQFKNILIVAGEQSGDMHAASFVTSLLEKEPLIHFFGIGGEHMRRAGVQLLMNNEYFGVTGLTEVLSHLRDLHLIYKTIKQFLENTKPDLLVLIDCPGFNLKLAKYAKTHHNTQILYYISPQIWAWKANRIHFIKQYIDKMAVIFPFEKEIYTKAEVPVAFVGHPLTHSIKDNYPRDEIINRLNLPIDKKIIAVLPGSRKTEIKRHIPTIITAAKKLYAADSTLHFVIPLATSLKTAILFPYQLDKYPFITVVSGNSVEVSACSHAIIVASGTASLESALLKIPMCIMYKTSFLAYIAAFKLVKIKYLGLCNVLNNQMIVPEFIQYDFNETELYRVLKLLIYDKNYRNQIVQNLENLKHSLSSLAADSSMPDLILKMLHNQQ